MRVGGREMIKEPLPLGQQIVGNMVVLEQLVGGQPAHRNL